jgi:hypothetical protein
MPEFQVADDSANFFAFRPQTIAALPILDGRIPAIKQTG